MNKRGFTLIEVLVSIAILATGIVAVLRAFETSVTGLDEARQGMRIPRLMRGQLEKIRMAIVETGDWTEAPEGVFEAPYADYSWRMDRQTVQTGGKGKDQSDLVRLTVWVTRSGARGEYRTDTFVRTGL